MTQHHPEPFEGANEALRLNLQQIAESDNDPYDEAISVHADGNVYGPTDPLF